MFLLVTKEQYQGNSKKLQEVFQQRLDSDSRAHGSWCNVTILDEDEKGVHLFVYHDKRMLTYDQTADVLTETLEALEKNKTAAAA